MENAHKDIKAIGLKYFFDENEAWSDVAKEFFAKFSSIYSGSVRSDYLFSYIGDNRKMFSKSQKDIQKFLSKSEGSAGYINFLSSVFESSDNYAIFRAIRDRLLHDVSAYKRIQVLYDGKDIEHASFGQKCTAVMVILLLFGNYPLIVDEPEAHLDSALIANYLVPLIKRNKPNRQVIFATHNANFVINGDAEKIVILSNETGVSEVCETTIEDLDQREQLLRLEGGKEAFKARGEKLELLI